MKAQIALLTLFVAGCFGTSCTVTPQSSYTTTDASVLTSIAYITTFQLSCTPAVTSNLYFATGPEFSQLVQLSPNTYQISWTTDVAQATKGDHQVEIYNEEGKKSRKAVASLIVNHPGAYNGVWMSSEHLAAIVSVAVAYAALTAKGTLVA